VRHIGKALVQAMEMALAAGDPEASELVAAECVTLAETKDHLNWTLIGHFLEEVAVPGSLEATHGSIEAEEDEHLYHARGWTRELWLAALGLDAVLPPPEEGEHACSVAEAEAAAQRRVDYLE